MTKGTVRSNFVRLNSKNDYQAQFFFFLHFYFELFLHLDNCFAIVG